MTINACYGPATPDAGSVMPQHEYDRPMPTSDLAARIDHTALKPETLKADVLRLADEALTHAFASVCVNARFVEPLAAKLNAHKDHHVLACAVAGFPLGSMHPVVMAIEATHACKNGAREIDVVAHLPHLFANDADALREDLLQTTRAVRAVASNVVVKVILETAALRAHADTTGSGLSAFEAMIATGCQASAQSGCDFVKTSTGFHPAGGATIEAVQLLRKHAGAMRVKASGGIRTRDDALRMIDAGADRLGTSSGVAIVTGS